MIVGIIVEDNIVEIVNVGKLIPSFSFLQITHCYFSDTSSLSASSI